ncbi:hypothetical protein PTTG_27412 [Puccinia triticina 1-1 BBBD Race 1]|uniref:Uncharacterized protein n=1 Tax=Puccinia triticina (isolate 1-1 / race 1 (BBBD)) TaxID=630390 RepID=A0A180GLB2_PUCT1|nr:hypothetical protein PTTG_27412 [Puccinia triticina 1-1 BBBD Race 1]
MPFTKLTLKSVVYVADRPRLGVNNLYKIPSVLPWTMAGTEVQPQHGLLLNVFTPAPMPSGLDPASWLIFDGQFTATSWKPVADVYTHAASFYSTVGHRPTELQHVQFEGVLEVAMTGSKVVAIDPDTEESCLFHLSTSSRPVMEIFRYSDIGDWIWITGNIDRRVGSVLDIDVSHVGKV